MLCLQSLVRRASLFLFLCASTAMWADVTLTPSSVTLAPGASQTFTASEPVTWSVDAGDLSYSDTSATYSATTSGSNLPPGTYTLTATSQADTTLTASAIITVPAPPPPTTLTLTPGSATVPAGGNQVFTANQPVTWSVDAGDLSYTDTSATYSATASGSNLAPGTYTLTATSQADTTLTVSATITVPAPPPPSTLTLTPGSATVPAGGSQVFTANQPVTWSVDAGSLSYSDTSATYTAAASGSNLTPGTYTLTATSKADTTQTAAATITVTGSTAVLLTPAAATVQPGGQQAFTANQPVTWSVSAGGLSYTDTSATFTASSGGSNLPPGTYTLTATSKADTTQSGTATITVPAPASLALTPASATVPPGAQQIFTANQPVTWSVTAGSLSYSDTSATFTASASGSNLPPGTYTLTATSKADATQTATATLTVPVPASVTLTPATATVQPGAQQIFTANQAVTWSVSAGSLSYSDTSATFTASASGSNLPPGTYTLTATSKSDTTQTATATLTVPQPVQVSVMVSPATATLAPNASQVFSAAIQGSSNAAVTWSVVGGHANGSISAGGLFTAPTAPGSYALVATSVADPSRSSSATVTVQNTTPIRLSLTPTEATLAPGATQTFQLGSTGWTGNISYQYSSTAGTLTAGANGAFTFTAPNQAGDVALTFMIPGTDAQAMGIAHVVVPPSGVSVVVNQSAVTLAPAATQVFTATVTGSSNAAVTWSVVGGAANGTVDATGTYTAPSIAGTYTVMAASVADPSKTAAAAVTVPVTVTLTPTAVTVDQGAAYTFFGSVTGASDASLTWTSVPAGFISGPDGIFTAPMAPGPYTVIATSVADPSQSASSAVTVPSVSMSLSSTTATVPAGKTLDLVSGGSGSAGSISATVTGAANGNVAWSLVSGNGSFAPQPIPTPDQVFYAPYAPGTCVLKATCIANPSLTATVTVTVMANPDPVIRSFMATPPRVVLGASSQLMADFGNGPGVVTPGNLAMTAGTPLSVSPTGSTKYTLTVTGASGHIATANQEVAVTGPGAFIDLAAYPGRYSTYFAPTLDQPAPPRCTVVGRDGHLYGIGGRTVVADTDMHIYRLDVSANAWTPVGVIPGAAKLLDCSAVALPDGKLLIMGGSWDITDSAHNGIAFDPRIYLFDPVAGVISKSVQVSGVGSDPTLTLLSNGLVLATGGRGLPPNVPWQYGNGDPQAWAFFIDPATLRITFPPKGMNHARDLHQAFLLQDGRVLLAGGGDPTVEVFDPATQAFTVVATLQNANAQATLLADGRVLFLAAAPNQNALFDPVSLNLAYIPDLSGDGAGKPLLLPNGLVLADSGNADATLWDPLAQVRRGIQGAAPGAPVLSPSLLPDGTPVIWGAWPEAPKKFDCQASLTLSPAFVQENAGRSIAFTLANLNGASVTWSASGGQITPVGVFTAPSAGTYCVTAATSDGRRAVASINAFPAVQVAFGPLPSVTHTNGKNWFQPGDSIQLSASVLNHADQKIVWSVAAGVTGVSITPAGLLAATMPGLYQILATPEADPAAVGTLPVWVWPADLQPPQISGLQFGPSQVFKTGGPVSVSWQITGWNAATGGVSEQLAYLYDASTHSYSFSSLSGLQTTITIPAAGVPIPAGSHQPYNYTITVWNPAGSTQASFEIDQFPDISIRVSPSSATLFEGASQHLFAALIAPTSRINWSATGGTVDTLGNYTAPFKAGTYTVTAQSVDDTSKAASAAITVQPMNLAVSPSTALVNQGQRLRFTAVATPSTNQITWSCSAGTMDSGTGIYTAPMAAGTYTVTATSVQDPSVHATASVTVAPLQVTLTVNPQQLPMISGGSASLSSSVQITGGMNTGVIWTDDAGNLLGKGGSAFYTAPLAPGSYTVTATSAADPSVSVGVPVTVAAPAVTAPALGVFPANATLAAGQRVFLGTRYDAPNPGSGLAWTASGGVLQVDAATASAFFIAPAAPGTYIVTVKDKQNLALSGTATLTVVPASLAPFGVTPSAATLPTGASTLLEAVDGQGHVLPAVQWMVREAAGGLITSAGQYFAPTTAGTFHVAATNLLDSTQTAVVTITVVAQGGGGGGTGGGGTSPTNQGVTVSPDTAAIPAGTYQSLSAVVASADDQGVTWTVENAPATATVDATGVFVANQAGTYRVFATSVANPALTGSAVIQVASSVQTVPGAPTTQALHGMSVTGLKDGRVLIAGGQDASGYATKSAWVYDPNTKAFTALPPMASPRAYPTALLVNDGRVLLAGGTGINTTYKDAWGAAWNAEVFDPSTNQFQALPIPRPDLWTIPGQLRGNHVGATGALLGTGQALLVGGADQLVLQGNGLVKVGAQLSDLFDPATNTFDLSDFIPGTQLYKWALAPDCFITHEGSAVVTLDDGSVLGTGGQITPNVYDQYAKTSASPAHDTYAGSILKDAWGYTVASGQAALPSMAVPRSYHTMTKLADGRVLIVGGRTAVNYTANPSGPAYDPQIRYLSTATAEIYDPVAKTFTLTGSLNDARDGQAAILLPNGEVLIAGGKNELGNGTYTYPHTIELYDPGTGQFRVMENLGYGLDEPKLALTKEGDTFIFGIVQGGSSSNIMKKGLSVLLNGQPTPGTPTVGVVSTSQDIQVVATVNQAVERFLDDGDQTAVGQQLSLPWKANVPFVAQREGRIRVQAFSRLGVKLKNVSIKVNINGTDLPLLPSTLQVQKGQLANGSPDLAKAIVQQSASLLAECKFDSTLFVPTRKQPDPYLVTPSLIRITLSCPDLPQPVIRDSSPVIRESMPFVVNYYPLIYEQSGSPNPVQYYIGKDDPTDLTNLVNTLQSDIYKMFPVSKDQFQFIPYNATTSFVWNENAADIKNPPQGNLLPGNPTAWSRLINSWQTFAAPVSGSDSNRFFLLLVPSVVGGSVPTGAGAFTAGLTGLGSHYPAGLDYPETTPTTDKTWNIDLVAINNMVHELGHAHGSTHTDPSNTRSGRGRRFDQATGSGCASNAKMEPSDQPTDAQWPSQIQGYRTGLIGVPGYDVVSSQSVDPSTHADIMDYCDTKWVSDYTYQKWWAHRIGDAGYPSLTFISPVSGSSVSSPVNLQMNIADDVGLSQVVIKMDGIVYRSLSNLSSVSTLSFTLQSSDLTGGTGGVHNIQVSVQDVLGRQVVNGIAFVVSKP